MVNGRGEIARGDVWWAQPPAPRSFESGFRRPVLIVQSNAFNRSRIGTVVVAAITSNLTLAEAPGNVRLTRRASRLPRASVVNVSQILTLDRQFLTDRVGRLSPETIARVDDGIRLVLGF